LKKGGSPIFHQDSKTIVADHQQLKSAIGAAAISPTHVPCDRSSVFLVPACFLELGVTALIAGKVLYVTSEPHPTSKRLRRKLAFFFPK
jgi:hypothetical protein